MNRPRLSDVTRLLSAGLLVSALALSGASSAIAGEIEADVILESYDNIWAAVEEEGWPTVDESQALVDDIYGVWMDTVFESHCERFAAAVWVQAYGVLAIAAEDQPMAPIVTAAVYLDNDISRLYENCLNEE